MAKPQRLKLKFGHKGLVALALLVLVAGLAGGYLYKKDQDNKRAAEQLRLADEAAKQAEAAKLAGEEATATQAAAERKAYIDQKLQEAMDRLHTQGSGQHIRDSFKDIQLVYEDNAEGVNIFPKNILPFKYYYSPEADRTFNICAIDFTVFICEGKLDRLLSKNDVDSGRCKAVSIYLQDPRLK